jgi:hypothetical protein
MVTNYQFPSTMATGGNMIYTVTGCYASSFTSPDPPMVLEDRYNPKMWAQWFREFLFAFLPSVTEYLAVPLVRWSQVDRRCRSAPVMAREWKLKLWKQKFTLKEN